MKRKLRNFDLAATLECGQCFRWNREADGSYTGVVGGRTARVSEETLPALLSDPFWHDYFDFGLDYGRIRARLSKEDPVLARAARFAPGMHILNQDPWETLCSFIISQNNNIPRIRGIIARLCASFGAPLPGGARAFPRPEVLAARSASDLECVRCGFRARYLLDAAQKTAGGRIDFALLKRAPLPEARETLMTITGVGPKVADCALLYGLHRLDAFPVDVWMKRAMRVLFPGRTAESFGPYAGIAQQYIFHYSRMNPQLFRGDGCERVS